MIKIRKIDLCDRPGLVMINCQVIISPIEMPAFLLKKSTSTISFVSISCIR